MLFSVKTVLNSTDAGLCWHGIVSWLVFYVALKLGNFSGPGFLMLPTAFLCYRSMSDLISYLKSCWVIYGINLVNTSLCAFGSSSYKTYSNFISTPSKFLFVFNVMLSNFIFVFTFLCLPIYYSFKAYVDSLSRISFAIKLLNISVSVLFVRRFISLSNYDEG